MSKPAVGVFTLAYDPFVGGAEIAVREIIRRLPEADFAILTRRFDRSWPPIETSGNYSVIRLGSGRSDGNYYGGFFRKVVYVFSAYRWAMRAHQKAPFSAVWAVMASYAGIAALLFKLRHPEVPLLLTLQEGDSESHILGRVGIFYPFWRLIFKRADYIQPISNFLADFARRHGANCPVEVVPNGVDLEKFHPNPQVRVPGEVIRLVTTSRLVKKNGIDIVLGALEELQKKSGAKTYHFDVFGDGPERNHLEEQARNCGVAELVSFHGSLDSDEVAERISNADIFVRPSRSEGLGNSFLEAMAAGLPIIATSVGGIADFLVDGDTGVRVNSEDSKDLADKINLLSEDGVLRKRIAENGRRLVEGRYSWDKIAIHMRAIFQKICV